MEDEWQDRQDVEVDMDRRRFLARTACLGILPFPVLASGDYEYLPCGQLVEFTVKGEYLHAAMTRNGADYALKALNNEGGRKRLIHSLSVTTANIDYWGRSDEELMANWHRYVR